MNREDWGYVLHFYEIYCFIDHDFIPFMRLGTLAHWQDIGDWNFSSSFDFADFLE